VGKEEQIMISRGKSRVFAASLRAVLIVGDGGTAKVSSDPAQAKHEDSRVAFSHMLPHLDGARLEATVVEVNYGPGESSPPHTHPCAVIGYVIDGTYRTQVKGETGSCLQGRTKLLRSAQWRSPRLGQ